jgi:hypothetical protein
MSQGNELVWHPKPEWTSAAARNYRTSTRDLGPLLLGVQDLHNLIS